MRLPKAGAKPETTADNKRNPAQGRVMLYAVRADRPLPRELHRRFYALCSPGRRDRLQRFAREEDARRSLLAEMLLRAALRKDWQASGSPESLDFEENRYGKPSLRGAARLQFNLSHSGDWCVCAVSESAVGIDVEQIRQQELDWADKLLADDEKAELLALTGYDRLKRFYEIWTLKESYVKALGRGLSHGLNTFSVTAASLGALAPYRAAGYWLDDSHPAAVCAMGGLPQRWAILSPFDIWSLLDHEIEAMRGECGE